MDDRCIIFSVFLYSFCFITSIELLISYLNSGYSTWVFTISILKYNTGKLNFNIITLEIKEKQHFCEKHYSYKYFTIYWLSFDIHDKKFPFFRVKKVFFLLHTNTNIFDIFMCFSNWNLFFLVFIWMFA